MIKSDLNEDFPDNTTISPLHPASVTYDYPQHSGSSKTSIVLAHISFLICNILLVLWMGAMVSGNQGLITNVLSYFTNIFTHFSLIGLIGLISFSLLALTPILGLVAYLKQLYYRESSAASIWRILLVGQLLLFVLALSSFFLASSGLNGGAVFTYFLLVLGPLLHLATYIVPRNIVGKSLPLSTALVLSVSASLVYSYLSLLLAFIIPILLGFVVNVATSTHIARSASDLYVYVIFPILVIGGTLLLSVPYLISIAAIRRTIRLYKRANDQLPKYVPFGLSLSTFAFIFTAIMVGSQPTTLIHLSKLNQQNPEMSYQEQKAYANQLIPLKHQINQEYLSLINTHARYLVPNNDDISQGYQELLYFPVGAANIVNATFLTIAYPFVEPVAAKQESVVGGVSADTYSHQFFTVFGYYPGTSSTRFGNIRDEVAAVNLVRREISAQSEVAGKLAEVTITEEYTNSTNREQEVVYEFSLPEAAVITDLKLGANLEFQGQIAPRGAAEQVFNEQMRVMIDPALIEQVGPSQYRLRVFPVPPKNQEDSQQNLKVSFSYITTLEPEGFALPQYSLEENVATRLANRPSPQLDGSNISSSSDGKYLAVEGARSYCQQPFSPTQIAAAMLAPTQAGQNFCQSSIDWMSEIANQRIAIIIDVSAREDDRVIRAELSRFFSSQRQLLSQNQVDVIELNAAGSQHERLNENNWRAWLDNLVFFGQPELNEVFRTIPDSYDLTIVIGNDHPNLTKSLSSEMLASPAMPFYWLYLDSAPPALTQQVLQHLYQNEVRILTRFDEVFMSHLNQSTTGAAEQNLGSFWSYSLSQSTPEFLNNPSQTSQQEQFMQKLIAADFVKQQATTVDLRQPQTPAIDNFGMESSPLDIDTETSVPTTQLAALDFLHQIALSAGVVTPYSSYIALINEEQQARLDELSQQENRFVERGAGARLGPIAPFSGLGRAQPLTISSGSGWSGSGPFSLLSQSQPGDFGSLTLLTPTSIGLAAVFILTAAGGIVWARRRRQP